MQLANWQITKVMAINNEKAQVNIRVGDEKLEQVKEFIYLGAVITGDGSCQKDIRYRIVKASSVFARLNKIWKDKHVTIQTKINLYEVFVVSVFLHGVECWTLRKLDEHRILTAEMGWLRKLAGISRRQRKKNEDIRLELNQMETLVEKIQKRRLQWFGHVKRMDNSRLPAKALETLVSGTRSQGRQKKRWMDNVKQDLHQRGSDIQQATKCTKDRKQWKKFVHAAPSSATSG